MKCFSYDPWTPQPKKLGIKKCALWTNKQASENRGPLSVLQQLIIKDWSNTEHIISATKNTNKWVHHKRIYFFIFLGGLYEIHEGLPRIGNL